MRIWLSSAALGIIAVGWLWRLPTAAESLPLLALLPLPWLRSSHWLRALGGLAFGLLWGITSGWYILSLLLPPQWERQDLLLQGYVASLPVYDAANGAEPRLRFEFAVTDIATPSGSPAPRLHRVRLSWYRDPPELQPGQRWQFKVRLRRPRGWHNPAGSDYAAQLIAEGLGAVGYVRTDTDNMRLPGHAWQAWHHRLRNAVYRQLTGSEQLEYAGWLAALSIGDRRGLDSGRQQLLRDTGTAHLLAISGLHIGFAALLCHGFGGGLARLLWWPLRLLPAPCWGAAFALLGALLYATMAGFALPTRRALIMVAVVMLAQLLRRNFSYSVGFCLALLLILLQQPLAAHSAGFWLSFVAVAALLLAFRSRPGDVGRSGLPGSSLLRAQWAVSLALIVPLGFFFQAVPLLSPIANLFAIPLVSLGVAPLCLLGTLLLGWLPGLGLVLLQCAEWGLRILFWGLEWIAANLPLPQWRPPSWHPLAVVLAAAGTVAALYWRNIWHRLAALILLLPLLIGPVGGRDWLLRLTVLDVGQGLAVLVRTPEHVLIYDTGPTFSRLNASDLVLLPSLRAMGLQRVDTLVVSHLDEDHVGGAETLLQQLPVDNVLFGESGRLPQRLPSCVGDARCRPCRAGQRWHWDGVDFSVWHPGESDERRVNDFSCVLLISVADRRFLLPGDIEAGVEARLLDLGLAEPGRLTAVVAPHHGSRTSSSLPWVQAMPPEYVIYPVGHLNRFGHPHPEVRQRYCQAGSSELFSDRDGAVTLTVDRHGRVAPPLSWRKKRRRYWHQESRPMTPCYDRLPNQ